MSSIAYSDERIVVVDKAAGLSLATRRGEPGAAVARLLATLPAAEREVHVLADDDLLLVHRLDVGTSGLVILARGAAVHRELATALAERRIGKTYLAVVWGRPRPAAGEWVWPLGPDRRDRRRMTVDPAGRPARSGYRVLGSGPHASLVALRPHTGRTHQLRVHASHAGHPIVGDDLYGGPRQHGVRTVSLRRALDPGRPLLHAWRLVLPGFGVAGELVVTAPIRADLGAALVALGLTLPDDAD